jgi:hypothetical protein
MRDKILKYLIGHQLLSLYRNCTYLHHHYDGLFGIGHISLAASPDKVHIISHAMRLG